MAIYEIGQCWIPAKYPGYPNMMGKQVELRKQWFDRILKRIKELVSEDLTILTRD